jgi:WD40 repeat protein
MELSGHADAVHGLDWIDANTLISGCDKSRVMVHDLRTANPILSYNLPGHVLGGKGICCLKVAHTQSGCMLGRAVVGCTGGIVGIFNPFESRVVSAFQPHTDDVRALTFSLRQSSGSNSTGVSLVTTSYDGTGALWDVKDADTADLQFEKHGTLVGHTDKILAVTASRDGHLVTSGADGCVLHWDT